MNAVDVCLQAEDHQKGHLKNLSQVARLMAEIVGMGMAKVSDQPAKVVCADLPVAAMVSEPAEWAAGD